MNQHIKVLYITYDGLCDPLGQSQVIPYLKDLAKKNINIVVLSFEKKESYKKTNLVNEIDQELSQKGIKWLYLRYHNRPRIFATLYDVTCGLINGLILINKYRLNIVHTRGYVSSLMGFWLKKLIGIKFIFDMRGFWAEEKVDAGFWNKTSISYKVAKLLEKVMLKLADQIVVLTEKAKLVLISYGLKSPQSIEVIPTCVDLNNFNPPQGLKKDFLPDKLVVLYSGSIGTFYGFKDAVEFFKALVTKEQRSFFLGLINNQPEVAENILKADGLPPHSYRILSLNHREVSNWVKEADVSLIFYHRDNSSAGCLPTKFAESLACGVPVIVNKDIGGCDEIVSRERIGFVLEDFTDLEYKKVIDMFLTSLKERNIMQSRCRKIAEKFFSLDSGVDKYFQVYKRLI